MESKTKEPANALPPMKSSSQKPCHNCGATMSVRSGACNICLNCGTPDGGCG